MHWAIEHIGKPWVSGARGGDTFDCWGLVFHVYKTVLKIDLPQLPGLDARNYLRVARVIKDQDTFDFVDAPKEFDVVLLGRSSQCNHVGIYTEAQGGGVVHCEDGAGVVFVSIPQLRAQNFNNVSFIRHAKMLTPQKSSQ